MLWASKYSTYCRFYQFRVLFLGVLSIRALLFGVYIRAPFLKNSRVILSSWWQILVGSWLNGASKKGRGSARCGQRGSCGMSWRSYIVPKPRAPFSIFMASARNEAWTWKGGSLWLWQIPRDQHAFNHATVAESWDHELNVAQRVQIPYH